MKTIEDKTIEIRLRTMLPLLNERQRRLFLANEANAIGYGGITKVSELSGVSRTTITTGIAELSEPNNMPLERSRRRGGGRKPIKVTYPDILEEIDEIIEPHIKGDPMKPLLWTSKSTYNIANALAEKGIMIGRNVVGNLLKENGYSLQTNRKDLAIQEQHPDRNAQFEYINTKAKEFTKNGSPVLSIDAKKKENIGNFKNQGSDYQKKGDPIKVLDHDFPLKELGKATPYGVYDVFKNAGFVNVGISADTAKFAVESIRKWWYRTGQKTYFNAEEIMITADCGGSNGYRSRLWKVELQEFANEIEKDITVLHYPPGTSKWNKIEHRLFSFISKNWRGKPLLSMAVIVNLIGATTTQKGLTVDCVVDKNSYERGLKVSDTEFNAVNITPHDFHGEWNYKISPQPFAKPK